jgi:ferritin
MAQTMYAHMNKWINNKNCAVMCRFLTQQKDYRKNKKQWTYIYTRNTHNKLLDLIDFPL